MILTEFNKYLKENVTNEIFEALVLRYIKDKYQIISCNINNNGNKIYTLQDVFVGDEYYLVLNLSDTETPENYPGEKYMFATKDEATLFLLVNSIWETSPREIPSPARCLLPMINSFGDNPATIFNCEYVDFTKRINDLVDNKNKDFEAHIEKLCDNFASETMRRLIQKGYLSKEKEWNRSNPNIILPGSGNDNKYCECHIDWWNGDISLVGHEPHFILKYHIYDEKDIPLLANQIVQVMKEKTTI